MNRELKARIVLNGLRQVNLAEITGISEKRISEFIYDRSKPSDDEMARISEVLGVAVGQLFPDKSGDIGSEIVRHVAEIVETGQADVLREKPHVAVTLAEMTSGCPINDEDK